MSECKVYLGNLSYDTGESCGSQFIRVSWSLGSLLGPPQLVGPDHFFGHVLGIGQDQQDIGHPPPGQKDRT